MNILILYGTQTGNAKCMAEEIYYNINNNLLKDNKPDCSIMCFNNVNDINLLNNYNFVVMICSTTGNGDFPDDTQKFWKNIKNRKLDNTLYSKLNVSICGLGDSNYSMFCYSSKKLQKRIKELSANEVIPLFLMDAVYDDEEQLNEYLKLILEYISN
tara:strand:+ start:493 stop:963 length:471 start_codon:yes stop_codon:yes gene_type:complete